MAPEGEEMQGTKATEEDVADVIAAAEAHGRLVSRELLRNLAAFDAERANLEEACRALQSPEKFEIDFLQRVNNASHDVAHSATAMARLKMTIEAARSGKLERAAEADGPRVISGNDAAEFLRRLMSGEDPTSI